MDLRIDIACARAAAFAVAVLGWMAAAAEEPKPAPPAPPVVPEPAKTGLVLFESFDDSSQKSPFHDVKVERDVTYESSEGSCKSEKYRGDTPWMILWTPNKVGLAKDAKPKLFVTAEAAHVALRVYVEKADAVTVRLQTDEEKAREFSAKVEGLKDSRWGPAFVSSPELKDAAGKETLPAGVGIRSIQVLCHSVKGADAKDVRLFADNVAVVNGAARAEAEKLYAGAEKEAVEATKKRKADEAMLRDVTIDVFKDGCLLGVPAVKKLKASRAPGAEAKTILRIGGKTVGAAGFLTPLAKRKEALPESGGYQVLSVPGATGVAASADIRKTLSGVLEAKKPEAAVILFDFDEVYRSKHPFELLSDVAYATDECLKHGCAPIVFTPIGAKLPKGADGLTAQESVQYLLRQFAERMQVPFVDAFGILNRGDDLAVSKNFAGGKPKDEALKEVNELFLGVYWKLETYVFDRSRKDVADRPPKDDDPANKDPKDPKDPKVKRPKPPVDDSE